LAFKFYEARQFSYLQQLRLVEEMTVLIEHDLVDYINAASTVVVAAFTAVTCFVIYRQLKTSKDIERAWVTLNLTNDPMNALMLCEGSSVQGNEKYVMTSAFLKLWLNNEGGNGPVWVKQFLAKMTLVDSLKNLPRKPEFDKEKDDQNWYPAAFVEKTTASFQVDTDGSMGSKILVVYGKVVYRDKFQEDRFSTFGYVIRSGKSNLERLKGHPEYNRNT
jgi:hypothetical protein